MKQALLLNREDTVATVMQQVDAGETVSIIDADGVKLEDIPALQAIRRGHKIALKDHAADADIIKYGHVIGSASKPINKGDYVHTHNLNSKRGRGDLN